MAESCPRPREFPEQLIVLIGLTLLVLALAAWARAVDPQDDAPSWSEVITVDAQHSAGSVLEVVFHRVASLGIGETAAAQLLKRLSDDVQSEVAEHGKGQVSVGMVVDAVSAAHVAKWSAPDMARLVLALDRELEEGRAEDVAPLKAVVARVRHGARPEEILAVGDVLKSPIRY